MARSRFHLIAPAGSARPFLEALQLSRAEDLFALVSEAIGPEFQVTGEKSLIEADEDDLHGGRVDDQDRARDITAALRNDEVTAIMLIRGGSWFTRVLPRIEFPVLQHRKRPVTVFGFSEATTLVNIVGSYPMGRGVYDMGPAFLTYGLRRHAVLRSRFDGHDAPRPDAWMQEKLRPEFATYFRDIAAILRGAGTERRIRAKLVRGKLPDEFSASFVGGNLTVLSTLVGSMFDRVVRPDGRWLLLEDFNDKIERFDRFLAHLTLAGYWDSCAGLLLGDFHHGYDDLTPPLLDLLRFHLFPRHTFPILVSADVGHVWPMSPLPLQTSVSLRRDGAADFVVQWPTAWTASGTSEPAPDR